MQTVEQNIPHEIPEIPWDKTGTDIFEHKKPFVSVVDYTTKFFSIHSLIDHNLPLLWWILKAYFQKLASNKLSSVAMVLNSKQMKSKY